MRPPVFRTAVVMLACAGVLAACSSGGEGRNAGADGRGKPAPAAAAPSSAPPQAAAVPAAASRFTLVGTGDVLAYPSIMQQAQTDAAGEGYDFHKIFAGVAPVVQTADVAICHMETVYGKPGGPFTGYPTFKAPPQIAQALLDTGYDGCSTASNHTLDDGFDGIQRTLDEFDRVGLKHAGSARTADEAATTTIFDVKGVKVAHLAWTYALNGIPLPAGKPWAVNVIDVPRIVEQARAARRAGADVVVLSLHWGTEWQRKPDSDQLAWAQELTASTDTSNGTGRKDIDLILGTHNHVPQPYAKVNGTWVVYGMGDQMANFPGQDKLQGNYSSIARFTFARDAHGVWAVDQAEFLPQFSDPGPPFRVVNLNRELDAGNPRGGTYKAPLDSIRAAVLSEGAAADGLREVADGR
ncbi:CapA family protein [Yinghuangia seranimata]|uniref:CapA family protein n=1 Tax=Yinghuangia seranimata TaxID=408067 RepID=UPI00248B1F3A|nr:CapA family protein [Yinghuangia seranimata]MDI2128122.1 CapA family protein [Yinghuangia seranimata]